MDTSSPTTTRKVKRTLSCLLALAAILLAVLLLPACSGGQSGSAPPASGSGTAAGDTAATLPESPDAYMDALLQAYYLDPEEPVHAYLQNNSIQRFFAMWLNEYMGEETDAQWDYTTLAPVQLLDHSFTSIADADTALYTCTFTTAEGETGYIIVAYNQDGPSVQQWGLHMTPYPYDLRANLEPIAEALAQTDIDLPTAAATRVEWIDTDKNRGDRIILFADGKGDRYVCYLGDDDFSLEKQ